MHKEIVRLENIGLTLKGNAGEVSVLRHINLAVQEGEKVAVAGPSGSGKTSLLMLIAGLERPSEGHISVCDLDLALASDTQVAAWRGGQVSIVFQAFHLIPTMTALENVSVPLELAGNRNARAMATEALGSLGLAERAQHFPAELSGGEQQRVAIARAFAIRPHLLLADEPTGNLDRTTGQQVIDMLFKMSDEFGTALILVTHDPELAARCGRTIRLQSGSVVV